MVNGERRMENKNGEKEWRKKNGERRKEREK